MTIQYAGMIGLPVVEISQAAISGVVPPNTPIEMLYAKARPVHRTGAGINSTLAATIPPANIPMINANPNSPRNIVIG